MKETLRQALRSPIAWSLATLLGVLALVIPFAVRGPAPAIPTASVPKPSASAPATPPVVKPPVVKPPVVKPPVVKPPVVTPPVVTPPVVTPPIVKPPVVIPPVVIPPVVTPPVVTPPVVTPPVVTPPVVLPPVVIPPVVTPPVVTPPVVTPPVVTPPVVTPPVVTPPVVTPPAKPRTVVSLTFDDGNVDQLAAAASMNTYGIDGTFFVVSGYVGAAGYFTRADLASLAAAGHEIGGHSVNHPDLALLPVDEVEREICNDRVTLSGWGYPVRSFAYPFASSTPANEAAAAYCGYNSARMLGDISSRFGCSDCDFAETLPPTDPYYTRALDQVDNTWTLQDLKNGVLNAERNGGWLQYTFHDICPTTCGELGISQPVFDAFLAWLAPRAATMNTVTSTVGNAVGGAVKPLVNGPVVAPPTGGTSGVSNPGLENVGSTNVPTCWFQAPYGDNVATFSLVSPGHTGSVANRITMSSYVSGDAKLLPTFDLGTCAPSVLEGHSYSLRSWYQSSAVTQFAVYLRTTTGGWQYWTSSPWFGATTTWTEAAWTTPVIPAGFNGISFGLNIFSNGELTTDDHSLYDSVGAPAPDPALPTAPVAPVAALAAPAAEAAPAVEAPAPVAPTDVPPTAPEPATEPASPELAPVEAPVESTPPVEPAPVVEPQPATSPEVPGVETAP